MELTSQKTSASPGCKLFSKALFINLLKKNFYIPLLFFITLFLGIPFLVYQMVNMGELNSENLFRHTYIFSNICNPWIVAAMAIFVAIMLFSYLFTAKNTYMMHAFPFGRITMFSTYYITGYLMMVVPFILVSLACLPVISGISPLAVKMVLINLFKSIELCLFFFSLAVFVVMISGRIITVVLFYGIINFLYAGIRLLVSAIYEYLSFGLGRDMSGKYYLSPLVHLTDNIGADIIHPLEGVDSLVINHLTYINVLAVVGVILIVIAYLIYKNKHMESVGSILPMRWTRPLFRWGLSYGVASILGIFIRITFEVGYNIPISVTSFIFGYIVFGFITFFAAQMLIEASFKVFKKRLVMEYIVMVIVFSASILAISTDLFGVEKRVPKTAELENVTVMVNGQNLTLEANNPYVADVIDLHQSILESKDELVARESDEKYTSLDQYRVYYPVDIMFSYRLKNGTNIVRNYNIYYDSDVFTPWDEKAEVLEDIYSDPENIRSSLFGGYSPDELKPIGYNDFFGNQGEDAEDVKNIYAALLEDIEDGNVSLIEVTKEAVYTTDNSGNTLQMYFTTGQKDDYNTWEIYIGVSESMKKTQKALSEIGVKD